MKSDRTIPPRLGNKILRFFLRDDLAEDVCGDLDEEFASNVNRKSLFRARLTYWYQVVNYVRPFAIRKSNTDNISHFAMYQSYFKIGWRNLLRNKGYSFINIGGLAIGMAVAILNGLWVWDELSVNRNYDNYDRIAQIAETGTDEDGRWNGNTMTYPLGTELIANHHEYFRHIVRASWPGEYILALEKKVIGQWNICGRRSS